MQSKKELNEFLLTTFKRRFVINLDRRPDRYKEFCNKVPFDSELFERYSAIDGNKITSKKNPFIIGCHRSHKNILQIVVNDETIENKDMIFILEDDVFFSNPTNFGKDFINFMNDFMNNSKNNNINLAYIGGRFTPNFQPDHDTIFIGWKHIISQLYSKGNYKNSLVSNNNKDRTTNTLILNKYACREILEQTKHVSEITAIDTLYNTIGNYIKGINVYECFPHLCYSPLNYKSDIQKHSIKK